VRASESRLAITMRSIGDAVIATDERGVVTMANPVAEKLTGWPLNEAAGKPLEQVFRIVNEDTREVVESPVTKVLREGGIVGLANHTVLIRRDEHETAIEDSGAPILDDAGRTTGVVLVFRDATQERAAQKALQDADRRKDEFLAILAHELRNPLHPIRTLAAVLRAATPSAPQLQAASDIIDRQVRQMTRLLDDLLDVSRITLNKLVLRWDTLELASIIESALEAARPLIAAAHHKVTVTLPNLPVHVAGDETRLAQVFSNLLGNAAKYTPNGGRLAVAVEVQEGYVSVAVRDGGIGIAPDFLPHVFEMFSQADSPLERSAGGLGIGLALVRGLTELHGGTVEARSDGRGCGSEFIVRLPVTQAPRAQPGHTALSRREGGCRYRVLVVDDNTDGADSMKLLLESLDNEVRVAYDGVAAMEAAESFSPDVVLLDIGLPKLNGYEVARWIRTQSWGTRAVLFAVSGWGQQEDKRRAEEAGFDRHLTKPIDPTELMNLLAALRSNASR
jgi:PAS domain S-box-containing protein